MDFFVVKVKIKKEKNITQWHELIGKEYWKLKDYILKMWIALLKLFINFYFHIIFSEKVYTKLYSFSLPWYFKTSIFVSTIGCMFEWLAWDHVEDISYAAIEVDRSAWRNPCAQNECLCAWHCILCMTMLIYLTQPPPIQIYNPTQNLNGFS